MPIHIPEGHYEPETLLKLAMQALEAQYGVEQAFRYTEPILTVYQQLKERKQKRCWLMQLPAVIWVTTNAED